jgi:hypothetical protein
LIDTGTLLARNVVLGQMNPVPLSVLLGGMGKQTWVPAMEYVLISQRLQVKPTMLPLASFMAFAK